MPDISVQGTVIQFPDTGSSPDWSEAIIQFAQAVEQALVGAVGEFDVPAQTFTLTSNVNTNLNVPNLGFNTTVVRGADINYTVYRKSSTETLTEAGTLLVVYNPDAVGAKWSLSNDYTGEANATFNITDAGQVQLSSTALSGTYDTGVISYYAKTLTQT